MACSIQRVASVSNALHLVKYGEKTSVCAARTPLKRAGKTDSDHTPAVPRSAAAYHPCFCPHRFRLPRVASTMAHAQSLSPPANAQPAPSLDVGQQGHCGCGEACGGLILSISLLPSSTGCACHVHGSGQGPRKDPQRRGTRPRPPLHWPTGWWLLTQYPNCPRGQWLASPVAS